jgi:Cdc6-like AAA superfamily ATPase
MTDIKLEVGRLFSTGISHDESLQKVSQSVDSTSFSIVWDEFDHLYLENLNFMTNKS